MPELTHPLSAPPALATADAAHAPNGALCRSRRDMIEATARLCHLLGLPRSTGQIYGLLYLATKPLALDDIVHLLEISKGSASTGTRQLVGWGAIRQVWIPGKRNDYFEVVADLTSLMRASYRDFVKPRLANSRRRLDGMLECLAEDQRTGNITRDEYRLCVDRVKNLAKLQRKMTGLLPLAEKLL